MPLIKSAKKRLRQNRKRRERNFPLRSKLKTVIKQALKLAKDGKEAEAKAYLPRAFSVIDIAAKKNIIHPNNAARKKSRITKAVNGMNEKKATPAAAPAAKAEKAEKEPAEEKTEE
ncbi:30S ribosomal protein S20 [Candidatus Peregrinibacteria bacterium]|nr:30S ribosomal protein S20 [Candidatus Peregrinibacteria bacterium]